MKKLNILTLHKLGNPKRRLKAVEELEFMLQLYQPEHNYISMDYDYPVPDYIKDVQFDAVLINPTFLGARSWPNQYQQVREKFDFIKDLDAVKIACPQDDYYSTEILQQWMIDWDIDHLFSVCPKHRDILYNKLNKKSIPISLAYTGYVSDEAIKQSEYVKPRHERKIDVCYRTLKTPPYAGSLSYSKYQLGDTFLSNLPKEHKLNLDISANIVDKIPGHQWINFIENAKFCLTAKSGSSLYDPLGKYRKKIFEYIKSNKDWSFKDLATNCFIEQDKKYEFTAISPRNLEAGLLNTVQIASAGNNEDYNGLLLPNIHYIPYHIDGSNTLEVLEKMNDKTLVDSIVKNCKELILDTKSLHFSTRTHDIINLMYELMESKHITNSLEEHKFQFIQQQYWLDVLEAGFVESIAYPEAN